MRKLVASILTLALVSSVSTAVFAADTNTNSDTNKGSGSTNIVVKGIYVDPPAESKVISVDITWDEMKFTYAAAGTWDPKTHSSASEEGAWSWDSATENQNAPKITVTNHSNTGVKASFAFVSDITELTGSFTDLADNALSLATAEGTAVNEAPNKATFFSITGGKIDKDEPNLGTITVTIAEDDAAPSASDDSDVTP